jgi:hypothetical protein
VLSDYVGGRYGFLQGTSMAAPHVAGAVALLMAAGLTNAQAVQRLLATADTSKSCGSGCKGRLDVAKAVAGLPPAGGGGAATTAPTGGGAPAASGSPAAPGPTTTARRSPGPKGTTATTSAPAPPEGAAPTPIEAPTTAPPVTAEDPGLTDVSIEAAAQAVDDAEDDGPPLALVVAGAAALLLVAVGTGVVARRRAR